MTILFMGGEMGAFVPSGGGASEVTTGGTFNSAFARCAIQCDGSVSTPNAAFADSSAWSEEAADFYLHFEETDGLGTAVTHNALALLDGADAEVIRIRETYDGGGRLWQLPYLNNLAVWTNAGAAISLTGARADYDLFVNVTTGALRLFVGGTSRVTATGLSLGHLSGVAKVRLYGSAGGRRFSQVIAADEPTIGMRLITMYPSGVGATDQWTGSYASIDEAVNSDLDFIYSENAAEVEVVAGTLVGVLTGYTVRAVGVSARAKRGASGPQNLQLSIRSAGTNYFSSTIALDVGYTANVAVWETDPATTLDWVGVNASAIQFGVKSIA